MTGLRATSHLELAPLSPSADDWQPWEGYVPPTYTVPVTSNGASSPSPANLSRGRGIALLHDFHMAEDVYAAHRIAHLERRLTERENVVSDMADEIARLRSLVASEQACKHRRRDFNRGRYTCVECGHDLYESTT